MRRPGGDRGVRGVGVSDRENRGEVRGREKEREAVKGL